jgi:hypothetical protein
MELDEGEAVFHHACRMGLQGMCPSEGLDLPLRPLAGLAQDEEPGVRSVRREAEEDRGR